MSSLRAPSRFLLLPLCISAALQTILALSVQFVEYDEAIFLDVARNITRTGIPVRSIGPNGAFFFDHTPLYVYALAILSKLMLDRVVLLRLVTCVFSLGSVVVTYKIVAAFKCPVAACIGATILSLNPYYAVYSYHIRMEVPMCFFVLLASYQIQRWEGTGRRRHILNAGICVAAAVMLKEIALVFWATATVYVIAKVRKQRAWWWPVLLLVLPSIVAFAVWIVVAWSLSPAATSAVIARWAGALWAKGATEGGRTAVDGWIWLRTVGSEVLGWCLTVLLGASLVHFVVDWKRSASIVHLHVLHVVGLLVATMCISLKEPRFAIALVPTSSIVVASTVDWEAIADWVRRKAGYWALLSVAGLGVWALSPLRIVPDDSPGARRWLDPVFAERAIDNDEYYGALARAGSYLKTHTPDETVISVIHEGPVVGYYADRSYQMLYTLSKADVLHALSGSEYLVYDHVVFVQQTEDEIEEVLDYVEESFDIVQDILDPYRRVAILRRRQE